MSLHNAKSILIFNRLKRFTAFCPSVTYTAKLLGCSSVLISNACKGQNRSITAKGYYVRFGVLADVANNSTLQEFDNAHNITARYYKKATISRSGLGLKYQMIHKNLLT